MKTGHVRMRISYSAVIVACVLLGTSDGTVAAQQTKYGVKVEAVQAAPLAAARTYVWMASHPSFDKNIDRIIVAAVDRELAARGLTKLASGAGDTVVSYDVTNRTDVDANSKPKADGTLSEYLVGTLVVDLRDAAGSRSLFKVRMDTPLEGTRATMEAPINAAVTAMFEKYPTPAKR